MQKRKYIICGGFEYITYYCRNRKEIKDNRRTEIGRQECWPSSNKFKVLTSKVIQVQIFNKEKKKEGNVVERSDSKDKVETRRQKRWNYCRGIIGQ